MDVSLRMPDMALLLPAAVVPPPARKSVRRSAPARMVKSVTLLDEAALEAVSLVSSSQ
jgi:hypothetical protein